MKTVMLACEILRPELEALAASMPEAPEITFLDQKLHDTPDILRATFQEYVTALENESDEPLHILCGYGLCGRALHGAQSRRATLIFPRLHDCIPLFLGLDPEEALETVQGSTLWLPPNMQGHFTRYLLEEAPRRLAELEKKYGEKRAARLMAAEKRMFENYTRVCYIRWPGQGDEHVADARKVAEHLSLSYAETQGSPTYLAELLTGGGNPERFLHVLPGQTIDMDVKGGICSVPCAA